MLPPKTTYCQFCSADLRQFSRHLPPSASRPTSQTSQGADVASWVTYVLASIWLLLGALEIFAGVLVTQSSEQISKESPLASMAAGVGFCIGAFGVVHALVGLGMFLKWTWIPIAVYIICGLGLLQSSASFSMGVGNVITIAMMIFYVVQILVMIKTSDLY